MTNATMTSKRSKGKVTLKCIADACNVKVATVSRVLNNKSGFSIRHERREQIIKTAQKMGYSANTAARSLRLKKTNQVIIHGYNVLYGQYEATYPLMLTALFEHINALGYQVNMTFPANNQQLIAPLANDGALFMGVLDHKLINDFQNNQIPCVLLNDRVDNVSGVSTEDYNGMTTALDHLYKLGHRRIAYRCYHYKLHADLMNHHSVIERYQSYEDWMKKHDLTMITDYTEDWETDYFADKIMEADVTAVISYDYLLATMLIDELRKRDIVVPEDISLIAFNILAPRVFGPALTSMQQPLEEMGKAAADLLYRKMNGEQINDQLIFPFSLYDKGTTAIPRNK